MEDPIKSHEIPWNPINQRDWMFPREARKTPEDASVPRNDRSYSALMATQPWEEALMLPGKPSSFL